MEPAEELLEDAVVDDGPDCEDEGCWDALLLEDAVGSRDEEVGGGFELEGAGLGTAASSKLGRDQIDEAMFVVFTHL